MVSTYPQYLMVVRTDDYCLKGATMGISCAAPPHPLECLCWVHYSKSRAIGHGSSDGETGVPAPLIRHLFLFRDNMGEACG